MRGSNQTVITLEVNDDGSLTSDINGCQDGRCRNVADFLRKLMGAKVTKRKDKNRTKHVHQVTHVDGG